MLIVQRTSSMDTLRKPFFLAAIVLILLVVLVETGSGFFIRPSLPVNGAVAKVGADLGLSPDDLRKQPDSAEFKTVKPAGCGITSMSCLDGMMLFTVALMAAQFFLGERLQGRVQGIVTLVVSFLVLMGAIGAVFVILAKLLLMVGFLLAIPFGTLVYLIIWGFFDTGSAAAVLGLLLAMKLGFAICLVLAQQRFLQNKGLVLIIVTSLVANLLVGFLHGIVPGFLVSITDAIAGIVVLILGAIWAVVFLVGSLISVKKALV